MRCSFLSNCLFLFGCCKKNEHHSAARGQRSRSLEREIDFPQLQEFGAAAPRPTMARSQPNLELIYSQHLERFTALSEKAKDIGAQRFDANIFNSDASRAEVRGRLASMITEIQAVEQSFERQVPTGDSSQLDPLRREASKVKSTIEGTISFFPASTTDFNLELSKLETQLDSFCAQITQLMRQPKSVTQSGAAYKSEVMGKLALLRRELNTISRSIEKYHDKDPTKVATLTRKVQRAFENIENITQKLQ